MNTMALQRRRGDPIIICCLVAFTLVLCGRSKRLTTSASADETSKGKTHGGLHMSDFFSSLYSDNFKKGSDSDSDASEASHTVQLTADGLSTLLKQFQQQQSQNQGSQTSRPEGYDNKKDRARGKSNRRKVLYDLSVRGHYERLLREEASRNATSSLGDNVLGEETTTICEFYNDGMRSKFDVREMAKSDESILSRSSHWTYKLCPKKTISQVHLEPSAIRENEDESESRVLKLPTESILSSSIQFFLTTIYDLGTYLPPTVLNYESLVAETWGPGENTGPMPYYDRVEYYVGGDLCEGPGVTRHRQSKVVYEKQCCQRRQSMMEEFFHNNGQIMIRSIEEPEPCRYILKACTICISGEISEAAGETPLLVDSSLHKLLQYQPVESGNSISGAFPPMPPSQIEANKQMLRSMFTHAYDSYFYNAFPASELKPLSCTPGVFDLVRVPALTMIDSLDALIIMGNYTEFARSVERLRYLDIRMKREFREKLQDKNRHREGEEGGIFSVNHDVSVFETTIRVLGGLLSSHQLANAFMANTVPKSEVWDSSGNVISGVSPGNVAADADAKPKEDDAPTANDGDDSRSCQWETPPSEEGQGCTPGIGSAGKKKKVKNSTASVPRKRTAWEYDGILLELAHDIGKRLLFAFDTETGIPYGTVNLLKGIPPGETSVASLAGAGTLSLEFELLSRLTGDQSFGRAAKLATRALWIRRSPELNLFGKHIDAQSGKWREFLSGIGSNSDSFYEYLLKYYLIFPDDDDFWAMFMSVYSGVHENSRLGEWYVDVDMGHGLSGHVRQVFESLMAFYPGLQVLLGELVPSAKTLNSYFLVREFLGLLPERFNFAHWKSEGSGDVHPLRPELLESCYFMHRASIGLQAKFSPCSNVTSSTHTSSWLWAADFALHAVYKLSWATCGFATVTKVGPTTTGGLDLVGGSHDPQKEQERLNIQHKDEMPSYFLSETIKYLYLTFDAENSILHRDSERDWVFTTEAHPIHYAPIFATEEEGSIKPQLDQVRLLLKEMIAPLSTVEDEPDTSKSASKSLEHEHWAKKTPLSVFADNLQSVERGIIASKQEVDGAEDIELGPPFQRETNVPAKLGSHGIFSSEMLAANQAHTQFQRHGKGDGLGKRCPNYHNPDLLWAHALHDDLDYHAGHSSSVGDFINSKDIVDERMQTALASVCFYGTDYYSDGILPDDESKSCPIEEAPEYMQNSKATYSTSKLPRPSSPLIPGSTRYDMGSPLGVFDVSAYPGGDGFVVKHVDSDELLEVSIFGEDPDSSNANKGMVVLVVLTVPPQKPNGSLSTRKPDISPSLSSKRLSGENWRDRSRSIDTNDSSQEDKKLGTVDDYYRRHVVVADMETNSFKCEVAIIQKSDKAEAGEKQEPDTPLANFPCSPAFFGKASMPSLRESGGKIVQGLLKKPPIGDELGCKLQDGGGLFNSGKFCHINNERVQAGSNALQLVRRGDCNFMRKAANHHQADGIIVINTNPYELFVMAGEKQDPAPISGCSSDDLPISVLVSGQDGESMLRILHEEELKGHDVGASISLVKEDDELIKFPFVKGSKDALQILASNGWGIHAVPQTDTEQNGWQLFITQHDKSVS